MLRATRVWASRSVALQSGAKAQGSSSSPPQIASQTAGQDNASMSTKSKSHPEANYPQHSDGGHRPSTTDRRHVTEVAPPSATANATPTAISPSAQRRALQTSRTVRDASMDTLVEELLRYGRKKTSPEIAAHVGAVVDEMIGRAGELGGKAFKDGVYAAATHKLYGRCVELSLQKLRMNPQDLTGFSLLEAAVDSAYEEKAFRALVELCEGAAPKLKALAEEVQTEMAMFRSFWRVVMLEVNDRRGPRAKMPILVAARAIFNSIVEGCGSSLVDRILALSTSGGGASQSTPSENCGSFDNDSQEQQSATGQKRKGSLLQEDVTATGRGMPMPSLLAKVRRRRMFQPTAHPTANDDDPDAVEQAFQLLFQWTRQFVMYGRKGSRSGGGKGRPGTSSADDGEAYYYRLCYQHLYRTNEGPARRLSPALTLGMIRSCRAGHCIGLAENYYTEYLVYNHHSVEEMILHAVLQVLTTAFAHKRVVAVLSSALERGYSPSVAVISLCMKAISETQNAALAVRGFEEMMSNGEQAPSPYEVFQCLFALARCGVKNFEDMLGTCVDNSLIAGTAEETAFLLLQHALNMPNASSIADKVLGNLEEMGEVPTERLQSLTLQIMLRCESPRFLPLFQQFCGGPYKKAPRKQWVDLLVIWADRRRYMLTDDDYQCIFYQLGQFGMTDLSSPAVEGYRTQVAQIISDTRWQPLRRFRERQEVVKVEARAADPRMHFLSSRKTTVATPYTCPIGAESAVEDYETEVMRLKDAGEGTGGDDASEVLTSDNGASISTRGDGGESVINEQARWVRAFHRLQQSNNGSLAANYTD